MRGRLVVTGVVAAACVALALGVTSAGAQGGIQVEIPDGGMRHVDLDHDGRIDKGERLSGRTRLNDPVTGTRIGSVLADCVATNAIVIEQQQGTWLCTATLDLADGHIVLQGEDPAGDSTHVFAVVGGTGPYRDARGEADVVDEGTALVTIHLEP